MCLPHLQPGWPPWAPQSFLLGHWCCGPQPWSDIWCLASDSGWWPATPLAGLYLQLAPWCGHKQTHTHQANCICHRDGFHWQQLICNHKHGQRHIHKRISDLKSFIYCGSRQLDVVIDCVFYSVWEFDEIEIKWSFGTHKANFSGTLFWRTLEFLTT